MPQLLLMRHGKAVQGPGLVDRDRRLTPRGRRDSEAMAKVLARDFRPDRILCSPAARTRETLAAVLAGVGEATEVILLDALYQPPGDYIGVIAKNGGNGERLLVIAHNPTIQETALALVGAGDGAVRSELHEKFPTSAVAVIAFDRPWPKIEPLSGRLVTFLTP
jgi:phosphohistidine phosphatase